MAKKLRTRHHKVVLNRSKGGDAGITFLLIILGVFMFIPMWYLLITALKPLGERNITPPNLYVIKPTMQNFIDLFSNINSTWVPISRYFFNTVIISVGATFGCLVLGSLTAYSLSKIKFPGRNGIFKVIQYSLMISSTISGITNFFIFVWLDWLNTYWISIVPVWASTLGLYLMKQFIDSGVSDEMIEAARIDGAGELRIYWQIVMPLVKPAWLTLLVTTFQSVWNAGASTYVWDESLKTFNSAIANISTTSVGASSAGSIVMLSVPVIIFIVNQAKIVETMGTSGMKD